MKSRIKLIEAMRSIAITALVALIALSFAACFKIGGSGGGSGGGGGNSALNGTWVTTIGSFSREMTLKNGNFEISFRGEPESKGTYTISGDTYTFTATHANGRKLDNIKPDPPGTFSISGDTLTMTNTKTGNSTTYTRK